MTSTRRIAALSATAALALPVVLWLVSTFALGGDLGRYGDDYDFHKRSSVNGAWSAWEILGPRGGWDYFWRPLHVRFSTLLQSALWEHPRINHLVCALAHAAAAAMLFAFLRRVRLAPRPAACAAMLFLVHPMTFEVSLWPSATSMAWGTCVLFAAFLIAARPSARPTPGIFVSLAFAALAFLAACWYEPPAAAMLAAPLIPFCARGSEPHGGRSALRRAAWILIGVAAGLGVYAGLVLLSAPPEARGGAGSFAPPREWPSRVAHIAAQARSLISAEGFGLPALAHAWSNPGPWRPPVAAALIIAAALCWAVWMILAPRRSAQRPSRRIAPFVGDAEAFTPRLGLIALGGAGLFIAAFALMPVAAISGQGLSPRMVYVPLAGLAVTLGALLHGAGAAMQRTRLGSGGLSLAAAALVPPIAAAGAIMLVGAQIRAQQRWRLDRFEAAQVARLVPDPPRDAVFVSLLCEDSALADSADSPGGPRPPAPAPSPARGVAPFDAPQWSVLELPWSIGSLRFDYKRADIQGIGTLRYKPPDIESITPDAFVYRSIETLAAPYAPDGSGASVIPWSNAVPLTVGPRGGVFFIDELRILRADNADFTIHPATVAALNLPPARRRSFSIIDPAPPPGLTLIDDWAWALPGSPPIRFTRTSEDGAWSRAVRMHPDTKSISGRAAANIPLPAGGPARLHLRAMMPARQVFDFSAAPPEPRGDGVVLEFTLSGSAVPLAAIPLSPQTIESDRGWRPITIDLPARTAPIALTVRALPGAAGNAVFDGVNLTPAYLELAR